MRESTIQRHIIAYLRAQGCYVFKVVGSPLQQRGTPDLLVCYQGRFLALEIKVPGMGLEAMQAHEMVKVRQAGGRGVMVSSVEDTVSLLANIYVP